MIFVAADAMVRFDSQPKSDLRMEQNPVSQWSAAKLQTIFVAIFVELPISPADKTCDKVYGFL